MAENLLKHLLPPLLRLLPLHLLLKHLLHQPLLLLLKPLLHLLPLLLHLLLLRPHLLLHLLLPPRSKHQASGKQKAGASRLFCFRHPDLR